MVGVGGGLKEGAAVVHTAEILLRHVVVVAVLPTGHGGVGGVAHQFFKLGGAPQQLTGHLVLAAAALTVLGILGGVGLWVPIFAGLTTITTATSFGVDLKRDIAEYAQKKAEAPTEERIKKVVSKDKDKTKAKTKKNRKDKTKKNKKG